MTELKQAPRNKAGTKSAEMRPLRLPQSLTALLDLGPSAIAQQTQQIIVTCRENGARSVSVDEPPLDVEQARLSALVEHAALFSESQLKSLFNEVKQLHNPAIRLPLMARLAQHMPSAFVLSAVRSILSQLQEITDSSVRAQTLLYVSPLLNNLTDIQDVPSSLVKVLAAAQMMTSAEARIRSLSALSVYLPIRLRVRLLRHVLDEIDGLERSELRYSALNILAEQLPQEIQARALKSAGAIKTPNERARALIALAPHLNAMLQPRLRADALEAIRLIGDEEDRAKALIAIIPYLEYADGDGDYPVFLQQALGIAVDLMRRPLRARSLVALSPHLTRDLQAEALAAVQALSNDHDRAALLGELAACLPATMITAAVAAAQTIQEWDARVQALTAVGRNLPENARQQVLWDALNTAGMLPHHYERVVALVTLLDILPASLQAQACTSALETARSIRNETARARALALLGAHLPPKLLSRALETAYQLQDPNYRLIALIGLAPYISAEQQAEVLKTLLNTARLIPFEYQRARAIISIAPLLPRDLLEKALHLADTITDASDRVNAYTSLAQYLPPGQRQLVIGKAWGQMKRIKSAYDRASALATIAPFLPAQIRDSLPQTASAIINAIGDEYDRTSAITILAPLLAFDEHTPSMPLPNSYQALEECLRHIFNMPSQAARTRLLEQAVHWWMTFPADERAYGLWRLTAQCLATLPLPDCLLCLSILMPVMQKLGGAENAAEVIYILEHI